MAAVGSSSGCLSFLKNSVLIPMRNRGLLAPLVAIHAARSTTYFLAKKLAFDYFAATVSLDTYADVDGKLFFALLREFLSARHWVWYVSAVYLALHVALGLAVEIATIWAAAMASCSGGGHHDVDVDGRRTLKSLPGKVGSNLRGPIVTLAFVAVTEWTLAGAAVLVAEALYLGGACLVALASPFMLCYGLACAVGVVASVVEPRVRGARAVGRARRLMRGRKKLPQAVVYLLVPRALEKAVWKTHAVVAPWLPRVATAPYFPLDGVVVYLLLGVIQVLCTTAVTAYYFDCTRAEKEEAGHTE